MKYALIKEFGLSKYISDEKVLGAIKKKLKGKLNAEL